jgi:hypothetical protein
MSKILPAAVCLSQSKGDVYIIYSLKPGFDKLSLTTSPLFIIVITALLPKPQ